MPKFKEAQAKIGTVNKQVLIELTDDECATFEAILAVPMLGEPNPESPNEMMVCDIIATCRKEMLDAIADSKFQTVLAQANKNNIGLA